MLIGQPVLIPVLDSDRNPLLERGRVLRVERNLITIEMSDGPAPTVGERLNVFHHDSDGAFRRVEARVDMVDPAQGRPYVHLLLIGPALVCDHRRQLRLDVSRSGWTVVVDELVRCRVLDICENGLSFDAPGPFAPQQKLLAELCGERRQAVGLARVCSVRVYGNSYRCGVFVDDEQRDLRRLMEELMWEQLRGSCPTATTDAVI